MLERVLEYIKKHHMLEPGHRVVVGVSGGADSLALIHILAQIQDTIPIELYVAHVNHGFRGQAALEDALFVEALAKDWGFPFFLKEAQVSKLATEWGMSDEQAGRRVRYEFFEDVRLKVDGHRIALAHHRDDQAETILHNIIRGTGLAGLSGMKPVRDGVIIRPLLEISRREIEDYCHANGLKYRTDHTNEETIYTRNRIRHMVIPMIEQHFNPNFSVGLVRMGDILRQDEEFLASYSEKVFMKLAQHSSSQVKLLLGDFNECPSAIKARVLRLGLEKLKQNLIGIEHIHIDQLIGFAKDSQVGSTLDLPSSIKALKDYDHLVLTLEDSHEPVKPFEYDLVIPGKVFISPLGLEISVQEVTDYRVLNHNGRCIYINADAVSHELKVRNRRPGDRFKPLGMKGTKKLKDFFIDNKISRNKRDSIPLVVDRDNIVWIVGHQMSEDYKVTKDTKRLLKLEVK